MCVDVLVSMPYPYSYCHESGDGIQPETEFMFDLEVPSDFIPPQKSASTTCGTLSRLGNIFYDKYLHNEE